jgi:uncharacterized membrane protein YfbV (UPF0208 family)
VARNPQNPTARRTVVPPLVASQSVPFGRLPSLGEAKLGPKSATTATAHKLAIIFYTMVTKQVECDDSVWAKQDKETYKRMENKLKRQAPRLGFQLVPITASRVVS